MGYLVALIIGIGAGFMAAIIAIVTGDDSDD